LNLTEEDWKIVSFFGRVQDQTVNLTPMGTESGESILAPRLEGWLAACEIYDVPAEGRADLIDAARCVFEGVHGRYKDGSVFRADIDQLEPPELAVI
jgi:hypothetical protein